jgi:hypothetical protein
MKELRVTVAEQPNVAQRLRSAFPSSLASEVDAALRLLPAGGHAPSSQDIGPIIVRGEMVHIPTRIYSPELIGMAEDDLGASARVVLACLFTRHHDGFVRERYVPHLLSADQAWVVPFTLQLVGEYVVEIIELLASRIDELRNDRYRLFAAENDRFVQKTRHRVLSYWDCYYRSRYPRFDEYPGFRVMNELGLWEQHDVPRHLAR